MESYSLPRLSIVQPSSENSSIGKSTKQRRCAPISHGDESMTVVLSAFYAKLLIVLGIALPVTSTIQNEIYTNITSDIYTIYLYFVSMMFLTHTFVHLQLARRNKTENLKRTRYGSFYLHMGVAGFSVGSVIHSCLQFGSYFDLSGDCRSPIIVVKPIMRILFMVAQTVFIFSYRHFLAPMRGVILHRFGLMHLIATNVCEWLNVVVQDTRDDIISVAYDRPSILGYVNISIPQRNEEDIETVKIQERINNTINGILEHYGNNISMSNESWSCNVSSMITPVVRSLNPYLRPCGVEYSLLCSVIIGVIWNDICTVTGSKKWKKALETEQLVQCCPKRSNDHFSVDCGSAHKGLFVGIGVLSGTIVSLLLFKGLFQNEKHMELALLQINIWETLLFIVMTFSSGACIQRMRALTLRRTVSNMPLEYALLLITQFGVYLYYLFQIIGAGFIIQRFPEARRATRIVSPLCAVIQSSCQTLLVLDAWTRRCPSRVKRPGRQLVTFLLVGNFALWLLNRVKNSRAEFHPLQMEFYGVWAWTLITHVSVPLMVCYRFQATVCFYEIWKNTYKMDKNRESNDFDEFEVREHHIA